MTAEARPPQRDLLQTLHGWTAARGPLYRRLADALRAAIDNGDLPDGARLPPERTLAEQLGLSRSTVVAAYEHLRLEDRLERQQGSGTRVRTVLPHSRGGEPRSGLNRTLNRNTFFQRIASAHPDTIDLVGAYLLTDEGLPERFLTDVVAEVSALSHGSGYSPLGHPDLRRAIARHVTRRGLPTGPEEIIVTNGAQQAIHLAASLFVEQGETVVVENPTYPGALDAFATVGARLAWVRTGRGGADVETLGDLITRVGPRLVYLIPTFHNPIGGVMTESKRRAVARLVDDGRVTLIDDECLAGLGLDDGDPPPPIAAFAPQASILTIDSVSKLGWGGLRVGWIRAPEEIVARLSRIKAVADLGGSLPGQIIAARILDEFDVLRGERRAHLRLRFDLASDVLQRLLPSWSWDAPRGGLCLWVRLPHGNAVEFAQLAVDHGVSVVAGSVASADGGFADYLRLPFGQQPAVFEQGIRRLAAAWAAYQPNSQPRGRTLSIIV